MTTELRWLGMDLGDTDEIVDRPLIHPKLEPRPEIANTEAGEGGGASTPLGAD
jgi:hypothetical protein